MQGVLDRFGQIEPKILFCADGYIYGGKEFDSQEKASQVLERLPSVEECVVVDYLGAPASAGTSLFDFLDPFDPAEIRFERVEFNHPLYILYSSGTTGVPKCIVHGTGGSLLQHLKEHRLQSDVKPSDRLLHHSRLDDVELARLRPCFRSDAYPVRRLPVRRPRQGSVRSRRSRGRHAFRHLGEVHRRARQSGLKPKETHRLDELRTILSTGSPLVPEGFDYIYANVKDDVCLSSISGGTDIVSCFVLGNPIGPVWRGEIQAKGLGMAVEVFDENGKSLREKRANSFAPSLSRRCRSDSGTTPTAKYRAAYFEKFPNVWRHGDWCEETEHGGFIIYGRSDAVLNPGGVRIGTAEIYRQVESLDQIVESLVIGQDWEGDVRVVLFVKLKDGLTLDESLSSQIKKRIRDNTTPRHVPAKILQVADIPRTKSGKIVELAVRDVVHGRQVKNIEALGNPEALEHFRNRSELSQ